MRAEISDLPVILANALIVAGGVKLIRDFTATFTAGPPTILIGPNGAGKTTLLRAVMGLIPLDRGCIAWGGRNNSPPDKRAIVFQRPTMLRRTVAGNVRYALGAAGVTGITRNTRNSELLSLVGLEPLAHRPARRLSGGEQQRLALARALARDPDLLLLDEPTASLDPAATKLIEDIVRAVSARGVKVIMTTHDLGQARRLAGDIALLHRGHLVEHAPAADFFDAPQTEEAKKFIAGELLV